MIDLIILALIAYFIIKKLKSILGEESDGIYFGYEAKSKNGNMKDAEQVNIDNEIQNEEYNTLSADAKFNFQAICSRMQNFSLSKFQDISSKVLERVIKANNDKNENEIRQFLSKELAGFVINSFKNNEKNNIFLVSILENKIVDVIKTNEVFDIKVSFKMEQINYITDENNNIIEGNKHDIVLVNEMWTFTHDFSKKDNTWFVSQIKEI